VDNREIVAAQLILPCELRGTALTGRSPSISAGRFRQVAIQSDGATYRLGRTATGYARRSLGTFCGESTVSTALITS
jgi:hypothetical protein